MSLKLKSFEALPVVFIATLTVVGIVFAWTEPAQNPPLGNTPAPINISSTAQTKAGQLNVTGGVLGGDNSSYWGIGGTGSGEGYGALGYNSTYKTYTYLGLYTYGFYAKSYGNYGNFSTDGDGSSYTYFNRNNYGVYTNTPIRSDASVDAPSLCMGGVCKSKWPRVVFTRFNQYTSGDAACQNLVGGQCVSAGYGTDSYAFCGTELPGIDGYNSAGAHCLVY